MDPKSTAVVLIEYEGDNHAAACRGVLTVLAVP